MNKETITVHDPVLGKGRQVEAYLVGGVEGVFAVWVEEREGGLGPLVCWAGGDDGYWVEDRQYSTAWIPDIIEAVTKALDDACMPDMIKTIVKAMDEIPPV